MIHIERRVSKGEAAGGNVFAAGPLHALERPRGSLPAGADWPQCSGRMTDPRTSPSAAYKQLCQQLMEGQSSGSYK